MNKLTISAKFNTFLFFCPNPFSPSDSSLQALTEKSTNFGTVTQSPQASWSIMRWVKSYVSDYVTRQLSILSPVLALSFIFRLLDSVVFLQTKVVFLKTVQ